MAPSTVHSTSTRDTRYSVCGRSQVATSCLRRSPHASVPLLLVLRSARYVALGKLLRGGLFPRDGEVCHRPRSRGYGSTSIVGAEVRLPTYFFSFVSAFFLLRSGTHPQVHRRWKVRRSRRSLSWTARIGSFPRREELLKIFRAKGCCEPPG